MTFEWAEEIPQIEPKGDIFRVKIFSAGVDDKIVKFAARFYYDGEKSGFMFRAIEGAKLLSWYEMRSFIFVDKQTGQRGGYTWKTPIPRIDMKNNKRGYGCQLKKEDLIFDSMFLSKAGKKCVITYYLTIGLEFKQEPSALDCKKSLKMPEKLLMNKKLCDIKVVCEEKIFECHKVVLSCQSDVFEAMFENSSSRFLAYHFKLRKIFFSIVSLFLKKQR